MSKPVTTTMDNRMAVLLARADLKDEPAALAVCDLFLAAYKVEYSPHYFELSQPREKGE